MTEEEFYFGQCWYCAGQIIMKKNNGKWTVKCNNNNCNMIYELVPKNH